MKRDFMKKLMLISLFFIPCCKAATGPEWESKGKEEEDTSSWEWAKWNEAVQEAHGPVRQGVKQLRLFELGLTAIPASLNYPQLEGLELDRNLLTAIPNLDLPQLQDLYLQNNQIEDIDPQILQKLPELVYLNLSDNPIPQEKVNALRQAAAQTHPNLRIRADRIGIEYYDIKFPELKGLAKSIKPAKIK